LHAGCETGSGLLLVYCYNNTHVGRDWMHAGTLGLVIAAIGLGGPLLLGLAGLIARRPGASVAPSWDWRLVAHSALLYTIAFNLVFFIQELFLVLPKAFTPGLRPTLYHNNHDWT